jgi:hypothetical protein
MRSLSEFKEIKNNLQAYVSSRKAFPIWYWSVYSSRLDSMFYKNLLTGSLTNIEEINKYYLKQIFYIYRAANSFGKKLIYVFFQLFVFFKFHPFSFFKLLKSAIVRALEKYVNKKLRN